MQFPEALVRDVARAVERLNRPGVEGWGLMVLGDMRDSGDLVVLTPHNGNPPAPELRWIPRDGRLIELGSDEEPGETFVKYYAHIIGDDVRYIRLEAPRFDHAEARYIEAGDVPEWALARLAEEAAV